MISQTFIKSTQQLSMAAAVGAIAATTFSVNPASAFNITLDGQVKGDPSGSEGLTTTVSGATVIDFNDVSSSPYASISEVGLPPGVTYTPTDTVVINNGSSADIPDGSDTISQVGAVPFSGPPIPSSDSNNISPYLSLPTVDTIPGTSLPAPSQVSIKFDFPVNYFGLHWGSMDDASANTPANQIEFFRNDQLLATFTPDILEDMGLEVEAGAGPDNQDLVRSNPYVNFFSEGSGEWFDEVRLTQLGNNNNIAFESDNHAYRPVPEPLTILGSGLALGFGAIFKKQQSRRRQ